MEEQGKAEEEVVGQFESIVDVREKGLSGKEVCV